MKKKINEIIQNYNLGNYLKAESLAKSLLTRNAKDYQLCNIYGLILRKRNKTEGASSYFQKSIRIKSDFFEAHFNLLGSLYDLTKCCFFAITIGIIITSGGIGKKELSIKETKLKAKLAYFRPAQSIHLSNNFLIIFLY